MINVIKNKVLLFISFVFLALIAIFIYQRIASEQSMVRGEKSYTVKKQLIKETLALSGELDAEEKITLRFQSSGLLTWVGVKEGDYVKKYQGIASQDKQELEKNLKKYLNSYMKSRWDFETKRDENDIKNIGGLSQDLREAAIRTLDKAQFDLDNAVLDVELKDIALKYAYLYSPIEGIVTKVDSPFAGVYITPTQAEFEIINPKTIYFSATADQTDVIKIEPGTTGKITFDSYPDEKIDGTVDKISFSPITGETGTVYEVKINFNKKLNDKLRLAMTGDVEFEISQGKEMLVVPSNFIKVDSNKTDKYVFRDINGKKVKTVIKTGEVINSETEVISGLVEGDRITN